MASHRRPKQPNRTRVTVLTATAAAAVALTSQSASAEPSKSEAKAKVDKLYEEAEKATESYNGAKEKQGKLQTQVGDIQDKVARGQEELNELRTGLGSLAAAQYRQGGIDSSVQLFLSSDPDTYLDEASALDQLSSKQAESLKQVGAKQRTLTQQRKEASKKLEELESTRKELGEKKAEVKKKLAAAQAVLNKLSAKERASVVQESQGDSSPDLGSDVPASQRGLTALNAAKTKVGMAYVYGATGPSSFDCSGLTSWAYSQAGVSLPRTSQAQYNVGTRISSVGALKPGDLVFFYSDLHHVGLYAGNGQVLHASNPTGGVKYEAVGNMPFMGGVRVG